MNAIGLRASLGKLPPRMRGLPVDHRGYPIPWFVARINGKPDFRVIDPLKFGDAIMWKRCWICGELLGRFKTFVFGPASAITRYSSEPPSHPDCARFAAQHCPFCANPSAQHRTKSLPTETVVNELVAPHNPGLFCCWTTQEYECFKHGSNDILIKVNEPVQLDWYARGIKADRTEVLAILAQTAEELWALGDAAHRISLEENITTLVALVSGKQTT